jgi:hypothetical protein
MLFIYARAGYEIGKVKRVLIDKKINWGYFIGIYIIYINI